MFEGTVDLMDEMEKLLAQLKNEYVQNEQLALPTNPSVSETKRSPAQQTSPLDSLLEEVKADLENPKSYSPPPLSSTSPQKVSFLQDNPLLQDLKTEYRQKEQLEQQRQQQEILEQQRLEKERQQRKRQVLRQQAQDWLKKLNPRSEEGRWFEEFSCSYKDKLEAAIDYLEALRDSHR